MTNVYLETSLDYAWEFDAGPLSVPGGAAAASMYRVRAGAMAYAPTGINYIDTGAGLVSFHYAGAAEADTYQVDENAVIAFADLLGVAAGTGAVD